MSEIYVDPAVTDTVILYDGQCYQLVGPSSEPASVFAVDVDAEYDNCGECLTGSRCARCCSGTYTGNDCYDQNAILTVAVNSASYSGDDSGFNVYDRAYLDQIMPAMVGMTFSAKVGSIGTPGIALYAYADGSIGIDPDEAVFIYTDTGTFTIGCGSFSLAVQASGEEIFFPSSPCPWPGPTTFTYNGSVEGLPTSYNLTISMRNQSCCKDSDGDCIPVVDGECVDAP